MQPYHWWLMISTACLLLFFAEHATADDRGEIEAVLARQAAAWNRGDIDGFMEGYWKSDELTFSSAGQTARGWKATKEGYQRRYPTREQMGKLDFSQLEISLLGDSAALVLGQWQLTRDPAPASGNFTLIVRRLNGQWLIIHDHTSKSDAR